MGRAGGGKQRGKSLREISNGSLRVKREHGEISIKEMKKINKVVLF